MFKAEINQQVLENQRQMLRAAMVADSEMGDRLREVIAEEMKKARNRIVGQIKFDNGDPRGMAHAIRRTVYKELLGGSVWIPSPKTPLKGSRSNYEPPRKLRPGQRGGNRRLRSQRTDDIMHYGPLDRGWILRMVNAGTRPRYANGRNGKWGKSGGNRTFFKLQEQGDYYRGSIGARNFFGTIGNRELETALNNLSKMINEEFKKLFKN